MTLPPWKAQCSGHMDEARTLGGMAGSAIPRFGWTRLRIQVASDLHLELLPEDLGAGLLVDPHPDAELLILAGDIHNGVEAIRYFRNWPVPVLYVLGNHEFYGQLWEDVRERLREKASDTSIQILDNDTHVIGDVRFLGTTLWTDFAIDRARPASSAMELAGAYLKDFFEVRIRWVAQEVSQGASRFSWRIQAIKPAIWSRSSNSRPSNSSSGESPSNAAWNDILSIKAWVSTIGANCLLCSFAFVTSPVLKPITLRSTAGL